MITRITADQLSPQALARHGVICLETDDSPSPNDLLRLATRLGEPVAFRLDKYRPAHYPEQVTLLDNQGDGVTSAPRSFGEGWHQDSTYLAKPPAFTVLCALQVPGKGGETRFADTRSAWNRLDPALKHKLRQLQLEHSVHDSYRVGEADVGRSLGELMERLPRAVHPVVQQHPRAGETLCLSPLYAERQVAVAHASLYKRLIQDVTREAVKHCWQAGQILAWDNRIVMHAASGYAGPHRRRMMRVVVADTLAT